LTDEGEEIRVVKNGWWVGGERERERDILLLVIAKYPDTCVCIC